MVVVLKKLDRGVTLIDQVLGFLKRPILDLHQPTVKVLRA